MPPFSTPLNSLFHSEKARIKIVACAIYTYQIFSCTYTLLFWRKIKICCDHCYIQYIRPQITVQQYILQDYSSLRIGFNMINKPHTLPIATP